MVVIKGNLKTVIYLRYIPERKILDGITFEVPAGKSVAIVGTSGSGMFIIISFKRLLETNEKYVM